MYIFRTILTLTEFFMASAKNVRQAKAKKNLLHSFLIFPFTSSKICSLTIFFSLFWVSVLNNKRAMKEQEQQVKHVKGHSACDLEIDAVTPDLIGTIFFVHWPLTLQEMRDCWIWDCIHYYAAICISCHLCYFQRSRVEFCKKWFYFYHNNIPFSNVWHSHFPFDNQFSSLSTLGHGMHDELWDDKIVIHIIYSKLSK